MKRLSFAAALMLSLAAHAQHSDDAPVPTTIVRQIRQGRFSVTAQYADTRLGADPNDAVAKGLKGTVFSMRGQFDQAMPLLEDAAGTFFYENTGLRHHANALRAAGDPAAAAALRVQLRANGARSDTVVYTDLLDLSEDFRQLGDLDQALACAEQAMALFPDRAASFAALAQIHLDRGDQELADALLWTGHHYASDWATSLLLIEGRELLRSGSPHGALDLLLPWRRKMPRDIQFWTLLAECYIGIGELNAAHRVLHEMKRFSEYDYPEQAVGRAHLALARGDRGAAEAQLQAALAALPGNPLLREAAAELGL